MTGQELEVLLGHFTFSMLLNRPALSVFNACYSFIRRYYRVRHTLWASVYDELRMATGLLPLLEVRWGQPWSPVVGCSDATPFGYAVQEATWDIQDVQAVSQWSERWRFKLGAGDDPRARALRHKNSSTR
jgi:hypothetical protein